MPEMPSRPPYKLSPETEEYVREAEKEIAALGPQSSVAKSLAERGELRLPPPHAFHVFALIYHWIVMVWWIFFSLILYDIELARIKSGEITEHGYVVVHKDAPIKVVKKFLIPTKEYPKVSFFENCSNLWEFSTHSCTTFLSW